MKNVAATSGHSVSLAERLVGEIARVGNWAGRDTVLNLLSRPPYSDPRALSGVFGASSHCAEYGYLSAMQAVFASNRKFLSMLLHHANRFDRGARRPENRNSFRQNLEMKPRQHAPSS
jgi:hypothetical protein